MSNKVAVAAGATGKLTKLELAPPRHIVVATMRDVGRHNGQVRDELIAPPQSQRNELPSRQICAQRYVGHRSYYV